MPAFPGSQVQLMSGCYSIAACTTDAFCPDCEAKMTVLYTAGYEGHTLDTFLDLLQAAQIEQVLDVRRLPQSRKPGFSKTRLREALAAARIAYVHLVALGTPRPIMTAVRATKNYTTFFTDFEHYLQTQPEALANAFDLVSQRRSLLLCLEAEPTHCHRFAVATALAALAEGDLQINHL